jgi:SagB-type dehydrogenase family enzyme
MKKPIILSFKPQVSLEWEGENPILKTLHTHLDLQALSPGLLEAVKLLCGSGATEEVLTEVVIKQDGFSSLAKLYYFLEKFIRVGVICYTIKVENAPLGTVIPLVPTYQFHLTEVPLETKFEFSRFAYCHNENQQMVVESPLALAMLILADWRGAAIAAELVKPGNCYEIQARIPTLSLATVQQFISLLWSLSIIHEFTPSPESITLNESLKQWEFHDLLFHTRSRSGRHLKPAGKTQKFIHEISPLTVIKKSPIQERIPLYHPDIETLQQQDPSFTQILESRQSIRKYGDRPITDKQLGEFLYRSARVKAIFPKDNMECSDRPYPSGGACYELELYIIVNTCENIPSGLYHYCPQGHHLSKISGKTSSVEALLEDARRATLRGDYIPQVLIIMAARFARVTWGYESIAYGLILKNVGALYQTMYLVATAMNLGPCALGGGNSDLFAMAANTDYYAETSVGEFMLGSIPGSESVGVPTNSGEKN